MFDKDQDDFIWFRPIIEFLEEINYSLEWEIHHFTKEVPLSDLTNEPQEISKDDFINIIKCNIESFDSLKNTPTQAISCFKKEIRVVNCSMY